MPRVGQNPMRGKTAPYDIKPVVLTVVTHLPDYVGYHGGRKDVIAACLRSMIDNAGRDFSLIVWDNGSCDEFLGWLETSIKPDILIRSKNVGKTTARSCLARMIHPRSIMAHSDDDMLFYPNWLQPQIDLLEHFPNVACVTGYPVRTAFRWGNENTLAWARENAKVEAARFIPQEWEDDFAESVGRDPKGHRDYTVKDIDYRITYNGVSAYATAHHCQFVARAETVARLLQYDGMAMGDERAFDIEMDKLGLRLATIERLTRHIGNVIDQRMMQEIIQYA